MKNQHKKIKGYCDLSQQEIDLMNEFKQVSEKVKTVIDHAYHDLYNSGHGAEYIKTGERWLSLAQDDLQKGFMSAVRSVAQPSSF